MLLALYHRFFYIFIICLFFSLIISDNLTEFLTILVIDINFLPYGSYVNSVNKISLVPPILHIIVIEKGRLLFSPLIISSLLYLIARLWAVAKFRPNCSGNVVIL